MQSIHIFKYVCICGGRGDLWQSCWLQCVHNCMLYIYMRSLASDSEWCDNAAIICHIKQIAQIRSVWTCVVSVNCSKCVSSRVNREIERPILLYAFIYFIMNAGEKQRINEYFYATTIYNTRVNSILSAFAVVHLQAMMRCRKITDRKSQIALRIFTSMYSNSLLVHC